MRYCIPAILWMIGIFIFSTDLFAASETEPWVEKVLLSVMPFLSQESVESAHLALRKLGHILNYAGLAACYSYALRQRLRKGLVVVFLSFLYAMSDEWHQSFTIHRNASWIDVGFDTFGAAAYVVGVSMRRKRSYLGSGS